VKATLCKVVRNKRATLSFITPSLKLALGEKLHIYPRFERPMESNIGRVI
jgi:hypothetical protein